MNERHFQPAVIRHLFLLGLNAALTLAFDASVASLAGSIISGEDEGAALLIVLALAAVTALLLWLATAALLRRLTLFCRTPELSLSSDGIHVRCYRHGFRVLFTPWFPWQEQRIAWTDFRGCRIHQVLFYDVLPVRKSLFLESSGPVVEITWGMFRHSVARLQAEILDYHQLEVLRPAGESARVPEFLGLLFRTPLVFSGPRLGRSEVPGTILALVAAGVLFCLHFREFGLATALAAYLSLAGLAIGGGAAVLSRWIRKTRFIRLNSEGLSVGPDVETACLIPWAELALVRVHAAGGTPSSLTSIELRRRDGTAVIIRSFPEAARLAAIIDPPADLVRQAWRLIREGQDPVAAARAAGLSDGQPEIGN